LRQEIVQKNRVLGIVEIDLSTDDD
jgi:hypothetical protein